MKFSLALVLLSALLASGALASSSSGPGKQQVLYGHVKAVTRVGNRYELRFDPAWWLTGVAAEHVCGCKPVANDNVVVDETHRLLTFAVAKDASVTVLVRRGTATISIAELAQVVQGKNPRHRSLLEPKAGFWIRVLQSYPSPVVSLDQQYQP